MCLSVYKNSDRYYLDLKYGKDAGFEWKEYTYKKKTGHKHYLNPSTMNTAQSASLGPRGSASSDDV
jgi:hypothetical protein